MKLLPSIATCSFFLAASLAQAADIKFHDIAKDADSGLHYQRGKSARDALVDVFRQKPVYTVFDIGITPMKSDGSPGVAVFDFDHDGDLDLYVTNGPGRPNSLFSNQLKESGKANFVDVGAQSGLAATDQDSSGVCVGDVDNDGYSDVLVLGTCGGHRLYKNRGNGTFTDITQNSGINVGNSCSASCSMGDVNGDGLLDILVANTYSDWNDQLALVAVPFANNQHNQLYINQGNGHFSEQGESAGIRNLRGLGGNPDGLPTITWAIALVDIDKDGDVDIVQAEDQGHIMDPANDRERGALRVLKNDGHGHFTDMSRDLNIEKIGGWMGLAFADFNCDGRLDIFATNFGDYSGQVLPPAPALGERASRWFLQNADGTFSDPGVGPDTVASVFGWGTAAIDYDNDGAADIVYHGGADIGPFLDGSNAGVYLRNQGCSGRFTHDPAVASGTDHRRRSVQGVASGDFDDNGFPDIASVSSFNIPSAAAFEPFPQLFGSPFDDAGYVWQYAPIGPGEFKYTGVKLLEGDLSVELNGGNENHWVKVRVKGSFGLTPLAKANRDGVGAVVSFTPAHGKPSIVPVVGGSSYGSNNSPEAIFGLGDAKSGTLEVVWPGGTINRFYDVREGERIQIPEIPCGIDSASGFSEYRKCVTRSLDDLVQAGSIGRQDSQRFAASAMRAYAEIRHEGRHENRNDNDRNGKRAVEARR
jgi:hypothetical protein